MTKPSWEGLEFLIGEWIGEGGGAPGQGKGSLVFHFELQQQVLLRKNHVDFPATPERPASAHDDLTIIYPDESGDFRAVYFDNEGHIIHYTVLVPEGSDTVTFTSDPFPSAPRFRNTYLKGENRKIITRFEIAPPGSPEGFSIYVEGTVTPK